MKKRIALTGAMILAATTLTGCGDNGCNEATLKFKVADANVELQRTSVDELFDAGMPLDEIEQSDEWKEFERRWDLAGEAQQEMIDRCGENPFDEGDPFE